MSYSVTSTPLCLPVLSCKSQSLAHHRLSFHQESNLVRLQMGDGETTTFVVKTQFKIINWWVVDSQTGEQVQADFYPQDKQLTVIFTKPPAANKYNLILVGK